MCKKKTVMFSFTSFKYTCIYIHIIAQTDRYVHRGPIEFHLAVMESFLFYCFFVYFVIRLIEWGSQVVSFFSPIPSFFPYIYIYIYILRFLVSLSLSLSLQPTPRSSAL